MKKIAAIHDLSGYGRASLTVAIPILTHMGFQVCPLPTAILSAHSEYKDFRSLDLTDYMESFISCLLYTSPSPRDGLLSRMPSSA